MLVNVTEVRKAVLAGKQDRILDSLLSACGLPEETERLRSKNPHFPWLLALPDDDQRFDADLLLKTLGYARLLSSGVDDETAWQKVGFLEKWGSVSIPTSFNRLRHRRINALRLHLDGMRSWMLDPLRGVLR